MPKTALIWSFFMAFCSFIVIHVYAEDSQMGYRQFSGGDYNDHLRKLQEFKASLTRHDSLSVAPSSIPPSPSPSPYCSTNGNSIALCINFQIFL